MLELQSHLFVVIPIPNMSRFLGVEMGANEVGNVKDEKPPCFQRMVNRRDRSLIVLDVLEHIQANNKIENLAGRECEQISIPKTKRMQTQSLGRGVRAKDF
jgi:hypothetical protein